MANTARDIGNSTRAAKIVGGQDRRNRLQRVTCHCSVEDRSELAVGREKRFKHRRAVYLVPRGFARADAMQQFSIKSPVRLFEHPNNQIASAVRSIGAKRFRYR